MTRVREDKVLKSQRLSAGALQLVSRAACLRCLSYRKTEKRRRDVEVDLGVVCCKARERVISVLEVSWRGGGRGSKGSAPARGQGRTPSGLAYLIKNSWLAPLAPARPSPLPPP